MPAPGAFRVTVNGTRRNVASGGVAIDGATVTLTLASAVARGNTVTVGYTRPSANPLRDDVRDAVESFTDRAVTNDTGVDPEGPPGNFWAGTLTVQNISSGAAFGCDDSFSGKECSSALTNDTFTHGGTSYQVKDLYRLVAAANRLVFALTTNPIPSDWTLHVGDREFPLDDATLDDGDKLARWSRSGLTWTTGQEVSVWLSVPSSSASGAASNAAASVTGVSVVSDPGADDIYGRDDTVSVRVTFSEPVDVTGAPRLKIKMDPDYGEFWAAYQGGTGTSSLTFTHKVVEPNLSTDGIAVLENTLELNGGRIRTAGGGGDAALAHDGLAHDTDHQVDWRVASDTQGGVGSSGGPAASVTGVSVVSDPGADDIYGLDDTIRVRATFSEAVEVTGTPRLKIKMDPGYGEKWAAYADGGGTSSLAFTYKVVEPNLSTAGIAVLENTLELNGGTIRTAGGGADAALAHAGLAHDTDHQVDWRVASDTQGAGGTVGTGGAPAPQVSGVTIASDPGADDTYRLGDTIQVRVAFNVPVNVTGSPRISIDLDPASWGTKHAAYASGGGTKALVFSYAVVEPNYAPQGIAVLADSLSANGGGIGSASSGTAAELGHTGLGHDAGHKVDWRPTISVADAKAKEGEDASAVFEVSLSRAFTTGEHSVTVNYATADGTAKAGEDYTAASGTLTFGAGESSKTVSVAVIDDAHDEGSETFTFTLSNAAGAHIGDGQATGTIENKDLMPAALLARFGRATAEQVVEQIEERMTAQRERGFTARLAGRELRPGSERDFALGFLSQFAPAGTGPEGAATMGGGPLATGVDATRADAAGADTSGLGGLTGLGGGAGGRSPAGGAHDGGLFGSLAPGGDLLSSSEFELNRASHGGTLSVWSRSSRSYFTGMEEALSLNGDVRTTMFGADWARGPLTLGLSVGHTRGLGGYTGPSAGAMTTSMTGFYPWVGYQLNDRVSVWAVSGYGKGSLSLTPEGAGELETGMSMAMTALGTRGELLGSRGSGGFGLAFKADALWVGAATELLEGPAGRLNASEAGATRVRTALEGSRGFTLGGGRLSLRPTVELGLRRDGGDAETGAGLDVGAGLAVTDAVMGLSLDVRVRTLLVHQAEGFAERGLSVSFGWDPTPSSPLGLSARIMPSWGGSAMGGAETLWNGQTGYGSGSPAASGSGAQLNAEVGYGLPVGARFVGTPRVGLRSSTYGREYRAGWGLGVLDTSLLHFDLGLEAQRRENRMAGGADSGVLARATVSW